MDENQQSQNETTEKPASKKSPLRRLKPQHGIIAGAALVIGVVGFLGGSAYTARQQAARTEAELRAVTNEKDELQQKLKVAKEQSEDQANQNSDTTGDVAAPKPEQTAQPTTLQKTPIKKPAQKPHTDKEKHAKNHVSISQAQPVVSAGSVTFTVQLPRAYGSNGYCKVLVKRDGDGAHAIERQVGLTGASSCSITVPRSDLAAGVTHWQAYASFEDYDSQSYSGWQDRKTFTL